MQRISIHDEQKLIEFFQENKIPKFRYGQIENAIYKNFISNFDEIETIPKELREILNKNCFYSSLSIDHEATSSNGQTTKILFKTQDGLFIESVIMRHLSGRNTLCISCQAGCPMACTFCATGKLWLQKNLELYEIVEQVMYAAHLLHKEWEKLRNVVFMGMGEPMLNYDKMKEAIHIFTHQKKFDLSNRRVTVSTCGIVPWINRFADDFPQTSLAVSLHAPNDEIRKSIMPVDHTYDLEKLMTSLDAYVAKTNKRIFYEYIMINGVNDHIKLADELWKLLEWRLAHVNFIPYNPGEGTSSDGYATTPRFIIEKFQRTLEKYGVVSTIRATMGDDIDAACGQLARKKKDTQ
jgi:23S rRNA (adenine2503-C2)-methyltransferase